MNIEKVRESTVYDKIMNGIDDFIKHGERTDLSGETRCVAYINKGKFTRWLKDNFEIKALAELTKPSGDAISIARQIRRNSACVGTGGDLLYALEDMNGSRLIQQFAIEYTAKQCAGCNKWISVEERLPEVGKYVLACNGNGSMVVAEYGAFRGGVFSTDDNSWGIDWFSNWMELPQPPKATT